MIEELKPYPEYKESGSRWLANLPVHWVVRNLRTLIRPRTERNRADLPLLSVAREKGVFVRSLTDANENHNVVPEDLTNYKVARAGSLVINKMKAWQGSMGIAPCDGIVSPAYFVFDFAIANPAFGQLLLRSKPYVAHFGQASDGVRVGQWDLTIPGMRQIPVLVPPPDEQAAIVRFLDWANGRLDRAIRAKRKIIALLNEQKQAIIHRAVTRGLDPSVPLKPSGIPWLGDIPEHWEVVPLKRVVVVKDGTHDTPGYVEPSSDSFPLITSKDFVNSSINFERAKYISGVDHSQIIRRSNTARGDTLMSMIGGNIGKAVIVTTDRSFSIKNVALFKTNHCPNLAKLILYYLRSGLLDIQISLLSNGGAQGFLGLNQIRNLVFPKPPENEMVEIVRALEKKLKPFDALIDETTRSLELLREYRTRLVADVVTGKLDVREAAAKLPEEAGPETIDDDPDLSDETQLTDEEAVAA